jgi:hypothetical protein
MHLQICPRDRTTIQNTLFRYSQLIVAVRTAKARCAQVNNWLSLPPTHCGIHQSITRKTDFNWQLPGVPKQKFGRTSLKLKLNDEVLMWAGECWKGI